MKSVVLSLLFCALVSNALSSGRSTVRHIRGWELYSWNDRGKWVFVFHEGSEIFSTSEDEIKKWQPRFDAVDALGERFMQLAEGDLVIWNNHFVHGFSFPDKETFAKVVAAAKRAGIELRPDRNRRANQSLEPTTMLGTSAAEQPLVPSIVVAHL